MPVPAPFPPSQAAPEPTARLTVDLAAVAANRALIAEAAPGAEIGAAVKADGYGLGAVPVARHLAARGVRSFFVATPVEGAALREALGRPPRIFVLNGLPPGASAFLRGHKLIPVLNTLEEVRDWARESGGAACAVQFDTGMGRAGLSPVEADALIADAAILARLDVALWMSHLACADEPGHPLNQIQLARFRALLARLPPAPASLANSAGALLGPDYRFDLVRPGIALYGGDPTAEGPNRFRPVARLAARIIGARTIEPGDAVGYGAAFVATRRTRLALCGIGYADGLMRSLSGRFHAAIGGRRVPYAGRVSMDLLALDVTDAPEALSVCGAEVELLGETIRLDDMARAAGTISYEVLTRLGPRLDRHYLA